MQYHWFSNAYVAAMSLMTGVDVPSIMLRLWILPFALLTAGLTATLATKLSGRPSAGAGAAVIAQAMLPYHVAPGIFLAFNHISGNSPSQYFAYPLMLLTLHALVDVARGTSSRGTYAIVALGSRPAPRARRHRRCPSSWEAWLSPPWPPSS